MTSFMNEGRRGKGTTIDPRRRGTQLHRPGFTDDEGDGSDNGPVTGWLVVLEGPGRGRAVELGFGLNTIGTSPENRSQLDFGDPGISRDDHFSIAFDAVNRKFHLMRGRGRNLVYVGEEPLTDARELLPNTDLRVGDTVLRFIALCGPEWTWSEAEPPNSGG
ncbi:MAG TPA: FHA domain-containing protein [Allosphingosinicella sp.]|jgi:hypothetical protein